MELKTWIFDVPAPYGYLNPAGRNVVRVQAFDEASARRAAMEQLTIQRIQLTVQ